MGDWRNLEEIMQDLSVAQGFLVPATLKTFTGDGPPAYNVEEESFEESYYASGGGGSDHFPAPNYKLIQKMLNMVKEDDQDEPAAHLSAFEPTDTHHAENKEMVKKTKLSARRPMPKDVIHSMFKKKSSNHSEHLHNLKSENSLPILSPSREQLKQYTPSAYASAYYSKLLEKSQLKERFEEDIWAKVERQMKDLEDKKKLKAELVSPKKGGDVTPADTSVLFAAFDVALPEHRHLRPGDCVVCIVAAKHGFYF